jgi:DNA-binding transcriptional MerR regulator
MEKGFVAKETRWVVGISQHKLDYWARTGLVVPSIKKAQGKITRRIYSTGDLVRLVTVKKLRDEGVSLQRIRKAVDYLKAASRSEKPLEDFELKGEKGNIFILTQDPKVWLDVFRTPGQLEWSLAKGDTREVEAKVKSLKKFPSA